MNPYERAREQAFDFADEKVKRAGRTKWTATDFQVYSDEYLRLYPNAREQAQKAPVTAVDPK